MTELLSADEIIAQAKAAGYEISKSQLARWHREGLLPQPTRQFAGRGEGSQSLYPEDAHYNAIEIAQLLKSIRSFETIGWRLWTYGLEVDERHWKPRMKRIGKDLDHLVAGLKTELDRDRPETDVEDQRYRNLGLKSSPALVRHIRKAVGDENFEEVFFRLAEIITGSYVGAYDADLDGYDAIRSEKLVDRIMGFTRARTDKTDDGIKWLTSSIDPVLIELSRAFEGHGFEAQVDNGLDGAWESERETIFHLRTIANAMVIMMEEEFGDKHKFGLWRASVALDHGEPDNDAAFLLIGSVFLNLPGKAESTWKFIKDCYEFAGKTISKKSLSE